MKDVLGNMIAIGNKVVYSGILENMEIGVVIDIEYNDVLVETAKGTQFWTTADRLIKVVNGDLLYK